MQRRHFIKAAVAGVLTHSVPSANATPFVFDQEDIVIKDYIFRNRNPDQYYNNDIVTKRSQFPYLRSVSLRLRQVQRTVGYGNFNVLNFDDMLRFSRRYARIGDFTKPELNLIEELFYQEANTYGFNGPKPVTNLTERISPDRITKISGTGHYLYKGSAVELYGKIVEKLDGKVTLTSGIRNIVKQLYLFVAKASRFNGNLSLASRSLAPPGYSFHGAGDFDVGKVGWGRRNFTIEFAETAEFQRLTELGYIDIRYPQDNQLGVRFEPWHIKVRS